MSSFEAESFLNLNLNNSAWSSPNLGLVTLPSLERLQVEARVDCTSNSLPRIFSPSIVEVAFKLSNSIAKLPVEEVFTFATRVFVSPAFTTTAGEKLTVASSLEELNVFTFEALPAFSNTAICVTASLEPSPVLLNTA